MTSRVTTVARIARNAASRNLVTGDIHGCFATLEAALVELQFEPETERLFSLGDLSDYRARSADALEWLQSRFTANDGGAWRLHWACGWFPTTSTPEQRRAWRRALEALPFTVTIALPDGGRVGLVHGYGGSFGPGDDRDWDDLCTRIAHHRCAAWGAMWTRLSGRWRSPVDPDLPAVIVGVDYVCHGHAPGPGPAWIGPRMLCIDTGVHVPALGCLTIAELRFGVPVPHSFERVDTLLPELTV